MAYDAILFDFDGVLAETPDRSLLATAIERAHQWLGVSISIEQTLGDFVRGDLDRITERCRSAGISREEYLRTADRMAARTQIAAFESGVRSVYDDFDVVPALECPKGIVTDNQPSTVSYLLRRTGLNEAFDTVWGCSFSASGFQRRKPAPDNLETAMETLGADDGLYVGDQPVDVKAAKNAGLDVALLRRGHECWPSTTDSPTYEITTLRELPHRLDDG